MVDDSKCDMPYDKFCTAIKELGERSVFNG